MSSFLVYGIVEWDASIEQPVQEIAKNADYIYLDTIPSGVNFYVIIEYRNANPINLTNLKAVRNPKGKWSHVWAYTKGTAPGQTIRFFVGGDATIDFPNVTVTQQIQTTANVIAQLQNIAKATINPATEDTLAAINSKLVAQVPALVAFDVNVGTTAVQLQNDTTYRDQVTLLADSANTAVIKVGTSTSQTYPLATGQRVDLKKVRLADIYAISTAAGQTLHVIAGGA